MDIFKNQLVNRQIEEDGFAIVPFADNDTIRQLKEFYQQLPHPGSLGTHVTMFNPSYDYRKAVDEKIKELCATTAENMMNGYRVLYTNFMIKEPGPEGVFPVHQDWTYVNEPEHLSFAFWIPLQDTDASNGALHVVPGSHRVITALRGPYVHEPFGRLSEVIKSQYSQPVNLKAGEAVVWDHRLVHFSKPNVSSSPRIAFTLIMVPKSVEVFHCFGVEKPDFTEIEKYAVDGNFFMSYEISKRPMGVRKMETVTQKNISFTENELSAFFSKSIHNANG